MNNVQNDDIVIFFFCPLLWISKYITCSPNFSLEAIYTCKKKTHTQETFEQLKATKRAHQARYDIHILPNLIDLDLLLNPHLWQFYMEFDLVKLISQSFLSDL